jgi:hypothetical protein
MATTDQCAALYGSSCRFAFVAKRQAKKIIQAASSSVQLIAKAALTGWPLTCRKMGPINHRAPGEANEKR